MAACGLLHPALAALIHVTSEMTFILNSARLLPRREQSKKILSAESPVVGARARTVASR
jgi:Cd2+/Zn2+-exporting ATPase/Cu+-exporting ATPase